MKRISSTISTQNQKLQIKKSQFETSQIHRKLEQQNGLYSSKNLGHHSRISSVSSLIKLKNTHMTPKTIFNTSTSVKCLNDKLSPGQRKLSSDIQKLVIDKVCSTDEQVAVYH